MRTILTFAALAVFSPGILAQPVPTSAPDLTGCWTGRWEDCKSGHSGPLKARFEKCDDIHYRATFTGRFLKVFPFRFRTTLNVTGQEEGRILLSGESNLGFLFGTFHYEATATDHDFTAEFTSRRYQGRFMLSR